MDLFDMLGIVPSEEGTETETTKQGKGKKSNKKASSKNKQTEKAVQYQLPLTVVTGWHAPATIEGTEKLTYSQLQDRIHELFPEYTSKNMTVEAGKGDHIKNVYVGFKRSSILAKGSMELNASMTCCLGGERLDISDAFDGADNQDVEVVRISSLLEKVCPIFRQCSFVVDETTLVPVFTQPMFADQKVAFPINILFFGRGTMQITQQQYAAVFAESSGTEWDATDGTVSGKALLDIVLREWNDLDSDYTVLRYDKEQKMVLVVQQVNETERTTSSKEDLYPTDGTTVSVIFQKLPLSPEIFDGKQEVTKSELQAYIAGIFPEYSGNNVDFVYNKETKIIVPVLRGSSKGALEIVSSEEEYERRAKAMAPPFCYEKNDGFFRVQSTPVMLTACCMSTTGAGWCEMRVPKIPLYLLRVIYLFFEKIAQSYETEVRVQIYYNSDSEEYELYLPCQEVTAASVYTTEAEYMKMSESVWPVLDIHSHCRFPALWSNVDDANELGNWIFGVIGSVGCRPEIRLRVGTGGYFMSLPLEQVFECPVGEDLYPYIVQKSSLDRDERVVSLFQELYEEATEKLSFVEKS